MNTIITATSVGKVKKRNTLFGKFIKHKYLYLMLIPVAIWYLIFCYTPMYGIIIAFQDYVMSKGVLHSSFVGLQQFKLLFADSDFIVAFKNTVTISFYRLVFGFPIPIIFALMLNEVRHIKFRKVVQTIVYLPHFISWVIISSVLVTIFNPYNGVFMALLNGLGIKEAPNILLDPGLFRAFIISTDLWKETGWNTVIYVAAMASVNISLYEAATVDGASRLKQMWHVTIPGIKNVVVILLILSIGSIMNAGFDQIYNLYNPMVYSTGDIIDTYIFRSALGDNKFSLAAAAGLFKSVICLALLLSANKFVKFIGEESIY